MTRENLRKLVVLFTVGLAFLGVATAPALAQGTGFYAGAGAGITTVDVCDDLSGLGLTSCDDEDTGLKIFGGYEVNQNFAVEFAWVDLGEVTATGPGGTATVEVDGLQLAAVGVLPINQMFDVFGKIGFYMWDVTAEAPGVSLSDDGTDIMFGIGGAWKLTQQVGLRAEWERFDIDGDNVDFLSLGVQFSF